MIKIKMTDAEISALECNGVFEDLEDRYLPAIIKGRTLIFTECAKERVAEIVNDISNTESDYAEYEATDKDARKFAQLAGEAASRLYGKILST